MNNDPQEATPSELTKMLILSILGMQPLKRNEKKGGKNGFVVDIQGNKICEVKNPAAKKALRLAAERIGTVIKPMWEMVEKLPEELRAEYDQEALFFAANCADIAVECHRALSAANRSYNSRDADTDDDQRIIDMMESAKGKNVTEKLRAVHAAMGSVEEIESFRRRYYRVKKRLGV